MIIEKLSETQIAIIDEISRAFDRLGAERGIFAALHSWGDTMSDLEVLQMLKEQNSWGDTMHDLEVLQMLKEQNDIMLANSV